MTDRNNQPDQTMEMDGMGQGMDMQDMGPMAEMQERCCPMMMDHMEGMGWMMGGMTLAWILLVVLLILGIAALVKYLFFHKSRPSKPE